MWNTATWMASRLIQTKTSCLKTIFNLDLLHPLWVLHLIHCFLDCANLLMPTEIEMIYVTLIYIYS